MSNTAHLQLFAWRWALRFAAAMSLVFVASLVADAYLAATEGTGRIGIDVAAPNAAGEHRLASIRADSDLAAFGARVGDQIVFKSNADRGRRLRPGETVALTLIQGDSRRDVTVRAQLVRSDSVLSDAVVHVLSAGVAVVAFAISMALMWRGAEASPLRLLALVGFAGAAVNGVYGLPLPGLIGVIGQALLAGLYFIVFAGFAAFCLSYPAQGAAWRWAAVRWVFRLYAASLVLSLVIGWIRPASLAAWWDIANQGVSLALLVGVLLAAFGVWIAWRSTTGVLKQRVAWIGLSLGTTITASSALNVLALLGVAFDLQLAGALQMSVMFVAVCAMGYAVLRGRVLDSGFALNRALVYACVLLLMAAIARVLHALIAGHLPATPTMRALQSLVIAAVLVAAYPWLRALSERVVTRLLFPRWRQAEQALQAAIADAGRLRGRAELAQHYVAALRAYADGARCVFFEMRGDTATRLAGDWPELPANFAPGAQETERLRIARLPPALGLAGDNALVAPVTHRQQLTGFIVLSGRPDFHAYRPDEVRRVREVATLLGEDLQADAHRTQEELLAAKAEAERQARESAEMLRDYQRELVRRFATPEVAADLEAQGFALGGRKLRATTLFCDIRGFTTLSEALPPEQTIEVLNGYYARMFEAISQHGGVVNQIVGDGLMAIFGAPIQLDDPAGSAVRAAQAMLASLAGYNAERIKDGRAPLRIGVGIATGDVIAGYTGTEQRATYTCVGDTVNLAARLEAMTKELKRDILIDGATRAELGSDIALEALGAQPVRGKRGAVEVFAVLSAEPCVAADAAAAG